MIPIDESQNKTGTVSVLVPSYNHAPYIKDCIRSIMSQTSVPLELIVIDDGSKDESVRVIEEVLKVCPFPAELIARENRGLCATLNEGLERAKGEFFAYLGSDDIWLPAFLATKTQALREAENAVLSFGPSYVINEADQIIGHSSDWGIPYSSNAKDYLLYRSTLGSTSIVYRKNLLTKHRWNSDIKLEDYDMYLRLSTVGEFVYTPEVLSAWRLHGHNTSANSKMIIDEMIQAIYRNAELLHLSANEIKAAVRHKNASTINHLLENGKRLAAARTLLANIAGFPSRTQILVQGTRILTPDPVLRLRRYVFGNFARLKQTKRIDKNFRVIAD
jgi:alpha-1,3-rhamnosyltransferase